MCRVYRADRCAYAAIDAFLRIDAELSDLAYNNCVLWTFYVAGAAGDTFFSVYFVCHVISFPSGLSGFFRFLAVLEHAKLYIELRKMVDKKILE